MTKTVFEHLAHFRDATGKGRDENGLWLGMTPEQVAAWSADALREVEQRRVLLRFDHRTISPS
jgi:hypothetical protein